MKRLIATGLFVLFAAGCGGEEKKPPPAPDSSLPRASDMFDKGAMPKNAKKTGPGGS